MSIIRSSRNVMDGCVLYGATGSAGEIGHMNMFVKASL